MKTLNCILFIFSIIIFGSVIISYAAEKEFSGSWTWTGDENQIQGFRIKDQDNNIVVNTDQIPPSARVGSGVVVVPDGGCVALFVVAVETNGEESGNSNILSYCPPKPKLVKVEGFSFTIE